MSIEVSCDIDNVEKFNAAYDNRKDRTTVQTPARLLVTVKSQGD